MNAKGIQKLLYEAARRLVLSSNEQIILNTFASSANQVDINRLSTFLYLLGCRASSSEKTELAVRLYEAAINNGFCSEDAYYNLGNAKMKLKCYSEAITAYTTAINLKSDFAWAYYNRGLAYSFSGDENSALDDFTKAALKGCDFDPFYESFAAHKIRATGFESLYRVAQLENMPEAARTSLLSQLETYLGRLCYLLSDYPDYGFTFSERSLHLRALLGDVLQDQNAINKVRSLFMIASEAPKLQDDEFEWRIQYLLGMMPYYTYCAQIGEQRYDMPEIEAFFVFSENSPAGDLLDSLIADIFPDLEEPCRIRRFAYFAKNCFQRAAELLCNQKTDSIPSSLEGISGRWSLEENVFRDLIRTCFFLSDSSTYFSAREQARFRNALLSSKMWAKDHATASDRLFLLLRNNFGPVRLEDIYKIIGNKGLLLDYFVYEIVEDAIICGAVTAIDTHIWERYVNWLPKQGKSDLIMFLRTHRQWGNRDHIPPEHYSRRIDEILLGPVIDKLRTCSRLAIVPFNYLHNIPFHALDTIFDLIKSGQLREIIYLPSIRFLVNLNKRRPKPRSALRCLFVGHSDANDIAINDELKIVRARFPDTTSLIDKDATIESVISAMPNYDVIHFACHGRFDEQRNCSYLVLANGNFYPEQVLKLKGFSPELVFTNACIAGVVSLASSRGDQTLGLHTALLLSGARQVIATMWEVDDKVACQFAEHFYNTWLDKLECSTAEVVLETQRMLKKQYEDIFFWGGHALFGDWR